MRKLWGIPAYCMQGYWWILQWEALSRFWITPWQSTAKKIWSKPTNVKLFIQRWYEVARGITTPLPPPNPPSQPSLTFSRTHSGTVRIKCFAQEHSTLTGPGLNPRCLDLELSALMPLRLYRIKQASLLLLVTCWNWFSFSLCLSNHHHHYYCQRIIANIFITIKISII